jgi:hypothetical protein
MNFLWENGAQTGMGISDRIAMPSGRIPVVQEAMTETRSADTPACWVLAATPPVIYPDETVSSSSSNILGIEVAAADHTDPDNLV